jgi:hemoglobin
MTNESASLYERVGGEGTAALIVDIFYAKVEADAAFRAIYPEDLEPGKAKLKLFWVQWFGGPTVYSEKYGHPRLRRRHFPFVINEHAAGRWLRYMREAMSEAGIGEADLKEIFTSLGPLAHHMVNAKDDVPRDALGDVVLS